MLCRKKIVGTPVPQVDVRKEDDSWKWYRETLSKGELSDYSSITSAGFVLMPASFRIWERIQTFLNNRMQGIGVQNCAFPSYILMEATGTKDTHKDGHTESLVTDQPTTSSIIYSYYARWIKGNRDLPLRLNQWKALLCHAPHPQPFFGSQELLVQEAHTAHVTEQDAIRETHQVLDIYETVYEELLAVPVVKGRKSTRANRNAFLAPDGADVNEAVVFAYLPILGQCIEAGTCCELGQSFSISKKHGIAVPDPSIASSENTKSLAHVWQNSWQFSNRAIGIMVATHGDNEGLVLPPNVAEHQVIIIPHGSSVREQEYETVVTECASIQSTLAALDVRAKVDLRDGHSAGWKLHDRVLRGAPLCLLLGMKELSERYANLYRRDLPKQTRKSGVPLAEIPSKVPMLLEEIQKSLLDKARTVFSSNQQQVTDWPELVHHLYDRKEGSICLVPHCTTEACEQQIEALIVESDHDRATEEASMRCLCIPLSQPKLAEIELLKCINPRCVSRANDWVMFGFKFE